MGFTATKRLVILVFALLGVAMSGYLSYWALWGPSCHAGPISFLSCGSEPVKILNVPTCVYGFFMFLIVSVLTLARWSKSVPAMTERALLWVASIGVLFSASLSYYELFIQKPDQLPACVYGFFLYVGILVVTVMALRSKPTVAPPPPTQSIPPTSTPAA